MSRLVIVLALAFAAAPLGAQRLSEGTLIRWTQGRLPIEGRILERLPNGGYRVQPTGGAGLADVPRRQWTPREIAADQPGLAYRVRPSRKGRGALIGLGAGAATGALIGLVSGDDPPGWFAFTAEEKALGLGVIFAPVGALVGALVAPGTQWAPVSAASAGSMPVRLVIAGDRIGVQWHF